MAEKTVKEKMNKKIRNISLTVTAVLIVFCVFLQKEHTIKTRENEDLKNRLEEMESKVEEMQRLRVEIGTVKEEIRQISKYSAYEFTYTSVMCHSEKNRFMGIDLPLTENNFIATIDGKMNIGIDADRIELSETTDSEGNVIRITLQVPHSEILDNYTIQESLKVYDEKNNIFNPVKVTDYQELVTEAEKAEAEKVRQSDLLQKSDEAVKYLLTSHLQTVYGDQTDIIFEYPDDKNETE